jgi:hypothetical protein
MHQEMMSVRTRYVLWLHGRQPGSHDPEDMCNADCLTADMAGHDSSRNG